MADSFFGFNTILPMDDDGGGGLEEPSEEEYDALNDETFGDAREGDWEGVHENLVRLERSLPIDEYDSHNDDTFGQAQQGDWEKLHENLVKLDQGGQKKSNGSIKSDDDDDLDFSRFNFDDLDIGTDDNDIKVQLDPSVWAAPSMSQQHRSSRTINHATTTNNSAFNPDTFIRQHFAQPLNLLQKHQQTSKQQQQQQVQPQLPQKRELSSAQATPAQQTTSSAPGAINILASLMKQASASQKTATIKMCTVEELERNMMSQQQQHKPPTQSQAPVQKTLSSSPKKIPQTVQNQGTMLPPPGIQSPRQQHPIFHQQGPMHPALVNQSNNNRFPIPPQMMQRPPGPPGPNMPMMGLSNFNQMPSFSPMRGPYLPGMPSHPMAMQIRGPIPPPGHPLSQYYNHNQNQLQNSVKQFNMKLMEEIQQNHPMLQQFNRIHGHHHQNAGPNHHHAHFNNNSSNNNNNNSGNNNSNLNNNNNANNRQAQQHHGNKPQPNGNIKQEPQDPYANLMSNRDKQWLISIQLLQLNTETPYFDDYYFTVFKERKAKGENRAHISNTLNHPFTQAPKGHAHNMLLLSIANKNGLNNTNRNGMHNRERKNSESQTKDGKEVGRNYTPLQFENSLGKLQVGCGSVTAPRKMIDMEVVSAEPISTVTTIEINTQRKSSRQLLLHIETLYRIVLKLEDLENPMAIAAAQILKQKWEKERQQALEQIAIQRVIAEANGEEKPIDDTTNSLLDKYPEPETHTELITKLIAGLTPEKVTAMMTVRKGKTLLRRCMPLIKSQFHRWTVWSAIFASLNIILKKEKDIDNILMQLYDEFEKHLQYAKLENVVQVAKSMITTDKKVNILFSNKFSLSTIVSLLLHAETLYNNSNYARNEVDEKAWEEFILVLSSQAEGVKIDTSSTNTAMDSHILKTIIQHLTRFTNIQTKSLLNILTQVGTK